MKKILLLFSILWVGMLAGCSNSSNTIGNGDREDIIQSGNREDIIQSEDTDITQTENKNSSLQLSSPQIDVDPDLVDPFLAQGVNLVRSNGYGIEYITLYYPTSCGQYKNEKYGFELYLPEDWDDTCAVEEYITTGPYIAEDQETKKQGRSLRFYFFQNDSDLIQFTSSKVLPNGWHYPFVIYIKDSKSYIPHIQPVDEPWQMEEPLGNNSTYYFLLDTGNTDWEERGLMAFGRNPVDFTDYMKKYFTTFDI